MNDHDAIRRIFVDYAKYLDGGDFAGYASLFAENGRAASPSSARRSGRRRSRRSSTRRSVRTSTATLRRRST